MLRFNPSMVGLAEGNAQSAEVMAQKVRKETNLSEDMFFIKQFVYGDILNFCENNIGIYEFGKN